MIVERLNFRAKYGRGDELVALMTSYATDVGPKIGVDGASLKRIYTDLTGSMFTVQAEIEYADLAAYAASSGGDSQQYGSSVFQQWFAKMVECTELGERQLLNVTVL